MHAEAFKPKIYPSVTWVSSGLEVYYDAIGRPQCPNRAKQILNYGFGIHNRLRNNRDCKKYWVCVPGKDTNGELQPESMNCPRFYVFNQLLEICEYYE